MPGKSNLDLVPHACASITAYSLTFFIFDKKLLRLLCKFTLVYTCRYVRRRVSCSSVRGSAVVPSTCSALASLRHLKGALSAKSARRVSYHSYDTYPLDLTTQTCMNIDLSHVCDVSNCLAILGVHTCLVCKKPDKEVRRCMIPVCGKFYHMDCIMKHSPTVAQNRGFRCSLHVCLACYIVNPANPGISKGDGHTLLPSHPPVIFSWVLLLGCKD